MAGLRYLQNSILNNERNWIKDFYSDLIQKCYTFIKLKEKKNKHYTLAGIHSKS